MPDELDPKKYHVLSAKQRNTVAVLIVAFTLLAIPLLGFLYYKAAVTRPAQMDNEKTFEIDEGQSLVQISERLYNEGLINSQPLFKLYLVINNIDDKMQAGVYKVPAGSSIAHLAQIFQHGTNDSVVTFLEGWRTEEIAREANKRLDSIDYENFIKLARGYEGYLFPDTYSLSSKINESELIGEMRDNFEEKTRGVLTSENLEKAGLTKEQAVIFASIVEREVNNEEDRPIVAGILISRWKNEELIGADATTQYAVASIKYGCPPESSRVCPNDNEASDVQWWPQTLTIDDLSYESPYNTRKNTGLPPTPISNPGLSAIKAIINPIFTDYNYYLTDESGVTHYAKTLEEHNFNVQQYL